MSMRKYLELSLKEEINNQKDEPAAAKKLCGKQLCSNG
jgi:hypothetical protein